MRKLLTSLCILSALLLSPGTGARAAAPLFSCRVGVGAPNGTLRLADLAALRAEGLINWTYFPDLVLPQGMIYIRMLRTGDYDNRYQKMRAGFEAWVRSHPGQTWIVGNEPDTTFEDQDALPPETYAERFYEFASRLRKADPLARIGFGTITQPTPLRLRYLGRAWLRLIELAGGRDAASALVDFWAIHAFILNEAPGEWGVGVPPGFEGDAGDALRIANIEDTYTIELFRQRVRAFRLWMAQQGERGKPLWVSEYGVLLPPLSPPDGPQLATVSDEETLKFMLASFDFLDNERDGDLGYAPDDYRLVQRRFWYSLNDHRTRFGGALYDSVSGLPTALGEGWTAWAAQQTLAPDWHIAGWELASPRTLSLQLANSGNTGGTGAWVRLYRGEPQGAPLAQAQVKTVVEGCGGGLDLLLPLRLSGSQLRSPGWFSVVIEAADDPNPLNNTLWFRLDGGQE